MTKHNQSRTRTFLAACIAPCASPLLTAIYAWLMLHIGTQSDELGRWIQFGDLWPMFLGEFVLVLIITWCVGYPIFAKARSRNTLSGWGLCISGAVTGVLIFFLVALVVAMSSTFSWFVLIVAAIGGVKGVAVAATFSRLAGIPGVATYSMLPQRE